MASIRKAEPVDAAGIARVHVDSWRTTYRGLLPEELLARLSYENREHNWHQMLTATGDQGFVYVAEVETDDPQAQRIVGFASGGFERTLNPDYPGELYAIYLLSEYQRLGIGRGLVKTAAQRLLADGYPAMLIWVLHENPARKFYEALGGQYLFEKSIQIGSFTQIEVAYGWKDLRVFTENKI